MTGSRAAVGPLRGVEDLSFTVADLEEATEFLVSFFGAEVVSEGGPVSDAHRSSMRQYLNADVRATIRATRLLRTPFLNVALTEASTPGARHGWPLMLDVGGWHLAGYVDDMDAAMEFLECHDVYVLGPGKKPTVNPPEVGEGSYACHCMTSWGFHFELCSYPNGRAYMADHTGRLWNPSEPDRGASPRPAPRNGIPGFRGFEHLSFAVADLEETTDFLETVLGCERFYDMGPMSDPHGSGFGAYANVDVRVRVSKVRLFRTPYLNLEVIEPRFPGQNRTWPALLDLGGWKLVWAVPDVDEARERLSRADVHLLGSPRDEPRPVGPGTRRRLSCLSPFGLYFDLVQEDPVPGPAGPVPPAWSPDRPEL